MRIQNLKTNLSFNGIRDENQPLAPALRDVFSDKSIPVAKQRLLWSLSEVPNFYNASKNLTKDEFVKLTNLIQEQNTNVLEMAMEGDIGFLPKYKEDAEETPFFSFDTFEKKKKLSNKGENYTLFDFIAEHPVLKIARDVFDIYSITETLPSKLIYRVKKDEKGKETFLLKSLKEVLNENILSSMLTGKAEYDPSLVIFNKQLTAKKLKEHKPINPKDVEPPMPDGFRHANAVELFNSKAVTGEIKESLFELEQIPYFNNLIRYTSPINLVKIAYINSNENKIIEKMLKNKITIGMINTKTKKEEQFPIIDIGKILSDMKEGKKEDLYDTIENKTIAIGVLALINGIKDKLPKEDFEHIIIKRNEENEQHIEIGAVFKSKKNISFTIDKENPEKDKFNKLLDMTPYHAFAINFNN